MPDQRGDRHLGDVLDQQRHAVGLVLQHHLFDGIDIGQKRLAAYEPPFVVMVDVSAAGRQVILFEDREYLFQRDVERGHAIRIGADFEAFVEPAVGVDFGYPLAAKLRGDVPVENRPQLHGCVPCPADFELQNFSQSRGHRAQFRVAVAGRDFVLGFAQFLGDKVPRPVDVGPVVEHDRHHRQAELRRAAQLLDPRQSRHRRFHWVRDVPLDLERRQGPSRRDHGDLRIGHVGNGIDRQMHGRVDAPRRHQPGEHQHQKAVFDRQFDERGEHQSSSCSSSNSFLSRNAPLTTTRCPSVRPVAIVTHSGVRLPTTTSTR